MKREKFTNIIAATAILMISLISLTAWLWINNVEYSQPVAKVYKNNQLIYTIELSQVDGAYNIYIGESNTIEVRNGEIGVVHADCPDKLCVRTGFINGAVPIVCLPNRLEIRVENNADFDAVVY